MSCIIAVENESVYPLEIEIRVYPEKIYYGDICFISFSVINCGMETLLLPKANFDFVRLLRENEILLYINDYSALTCNATSDFTIDYFLGHPVKPGATMELYFQKFWIPLLESTKQDDIVKLLTLLERGETQFTLQSEKHYHDMYAHTVYRLSDVHGPQLKKDENIHAGLTASELSKKRPEYPFETNLRVAPILSKSPITILPRPEEEWKLLQDWYLELPMMYSFDCATEDTVFVHPFHATASPYKLEASTPEELRRKRESFQEAHRGFFASMETRTPEVLARIERTNELAENILERAKQPNSTISQNMVEFIQLRSFLVDMRYARNSESEKAAFDELIKFVENAKYKELWLKFVDEIGFGSIANNMHFPLNKVSLYRKLFCDHFAEDFGRIGWTMRL